MSRNYNRREFCLAGSMVTATRSPKVRKPNFLFLLADDHTAHVLGADGNRLAVTPNLDRLASQGTRFARHYCNAPVCTPSRQSLLTGQLPHMAGVTRLPTPLDPNKPTLAKQFRADGYHTAVFGKMHFNRPAAPGLHGFETMMTEGELAAAWKSAVRPSPIPEGLPVQPEWRPFRDPASVWLNSSKLPVGRTAAEMKATFLADQAIAFMKAHRSEPFALWASFHEPHSPFDFPIEFCSLFDPAQFPAPPIEKADRPRIPLVFQDLTPEQRSGIRAAYYTSVAFLDQSIGRILHALEALGLDENTLVVYTSDHGYMLDEHGRFEKHCGYDQALRVPLFFRWKGRIRPRVVSEFTEHVDVAPTVLELLGLEPLPVQHGNSLRTYLEDAQPRKPRPYIFSEYLENEEAYLRTRDYKYVLCSGNRRRTDGYETSSPTPGTYELLFDLRDDPSESHDIAARPDVVQELRHRLLHRFRGTHPESALEPTGLSELEAICFYLHPRDVALPYRLPAGREEGIQTRERDKP